MPYHRQAVFHFSAPIHSLHNMTTDNAIYLYKRQTETKDLPFHLITNNDEECTVATSRNIHHVINSIVFTVRMVFEYQHGKYKLDKTMDETGTSESDLADGDKKIEADFCNLL